jgi:hypothetical protein
LRFARKWKLWSKIWAKENFVYTGRLGGLYPGLESNMEKKVTKAENCKWYLSGDCCRDLASARTYDCKKQLKARNGYCEYWEEERG